MYERVGYRKVGEDGFVCGRLRQRWIGLWLRSCGD